MEREILNHYSLIHVRPHAFTRQLASVGLLTCKHMLLMTALRAF